MTKIKWSNQLRAVHNQLRATNATLHQEMTDQTPVSGRDKTYGDMKANTLAVDIEFHLSVPSNHGKSVISIPVHIPGYNYFSVANAPYGEDALLESLQTRHEVGFDREAHRSATQQNGPKHYEGKPTLSTDFHHSEQAFYEYIVQRSNLDDIAYRLKNHGVQAGTAIDAVTIHMHSIRYVCGNCEIGGFGLMQDNEFKNNLSKALEHKGLELERNVRFNIQVSADRPCKGERIEEGSYEDVPLSMSNNGITASDTTHFRFSSPMTDLHNRTIMISTNPQNLTQKCLSVFDQIRQREYQSMIEVGRTIYEGGPTNLHGYTVCMAISEHTRLSIDDVRPGHEERLGAFIELAYMTDTQSNAGYAAKNKRSTDGVATKIARARSALHEEIAQEKRDLEAIKDQFLEQGDEIQGAWSMSANLLRAISRLQLEGNDNETIWDAFHGDHYQEREAINDIHDSLSFAIAMLGRDAM